MNKKHPGLIASDNNDSSGFLLWQAATLWQRGLKKELDKINITHPQYILMSSLLWLSKQQESVTQINLSVHSRIDPMTTSAIIKILQRKNLVEREEHHTDTRAKKTTLTTEGMKVTRQAAKVIERFDNRFFKPLSKKEKSFQEKLVLLLPVKESKAKRQ